MKHISLIATSLADYHQLKPLIRKCRKDESLYVSVIIMDWYKSAAMKMIYTCFEEEGFVVHEDIRISYGNAGKGMSDGVGTSENLTDVVQSGFQTAMTRFKPQIIVLYKNSYLSFQAAVMAMENHVSIARISGETEENGLAEGSFEYGITKLSHLHFVFSDNCRKNIIQAGEHPETVFHVRSRDAEQIKEMIQSFQKTDIRRKSFFQGPS